MNIKMIFGLSIFSLMFNNLFAQNTISGTVTEADTGLSLPGASVYIQGLKRGAITDINGYYKLESLKSGDYLFEVSFSNYKTLSYKLAIAKDTVIDFVLTPSVTELSEIIITGVTRSTERKRSPITIQTIGQDVFNQNSATNLVDGLKTVPGVSQITTGASISKPVIRGLGFNRVLTLNNGIRQEGQQWGGEHGIEIDEYSIERVEIVKGPGSLVYGSGGIAGVLNFLSPRALAIGESETRLVTNYQSNNNLLGYSLSNRGSKEGFQWLGQFSNKWAGDYRNKYDGNVYNSGFNEFNGKFFAGIDRSWGHSHLTLSSFNANLGIVEGERDVFGNFVFEDEEGNTVSATDADSKGYKIGFPYQIVNHFSAISNNYFILKKGTIQADLGFQNNRRREFEEPETPDEADLYLSLNTITYNVRYNLENIKGWEMTVGLNGMQQMNLNKGEEFLIPDYSLFDLGGFAFVQKTFNKFTFAGGIRFDNRFLNARELYLADDEVVPSSYPGAEQRFGAIKKNFNGLSGSVGLSYSPSKSSTFKLNLSRGFRAPNIAELASNGVHEGTFRYEVGNPYLKSESSNQIDIGYYLDLEHVTFELTPFVNLVNRYVFIQRLEGDPIPGNTVPVYEFTSGNATLYGGEVYIDFHPHPLDWLHIANSFSYVEGVQNKEADSTKYLPSIPAPKYRGEVKAAFNNTGKTLSNTYIKFGVDHYFKQDKIFSAYETETTTSGYTLLSVGVGADIKAFGKNDFISLYISGENLADVSYQNHLSRLKYTDTNPITDRRGVFNMGRNISVKLILKI